MTKPGVERMRKSTPPRGGAPEIAGREANTESYYIMHSKRTVSAKLKTNKKPQERVILAAGLGLPRGKGWEIKLETCMMPTITSYRNSSQRILQWSHLLNQVLM